MSEWTKYAVTPDALVPVDEGGRLSTHEVWARPEDQPTFLHGRDYGLPADLIGAVPKPLTLFSESGLWFHFGVESKTGVDRCDFAQVEAFLSCLLIANHDGPHIPITKEADRTAPEGQHYVITQMGRGERRLTPACRDDDHDRCKCLNPGQNPKYAGKLVDMVDGEFVIVGDCGCICHAV